MTLRSLLLSILLALPISPRHAAAQLEFAGIPWGTPREEASARIRAAGYTFRGVDQDGDLVFGAPDSVDLVALADSALIQVELTWMRDPDRLPARFDRMADSMRAALGPPDSAQVEEWERWMAWNRGDATLELYYRPRSGGMDTVLTLRHAGPGWADAIAARSEWEGQEEERDTTAVGDYHQAFGGFRVLIRVDTVKYERLGPQRYRARFLHNGMQMRRLPNGIMYSDALDEVELDCRAFRTRLIRQTLLYDRPAAVIDVPEAERAWTRPPPESPYGLALRSACEVLGRQP